MQNINSIPSLVNVIVTFYNAEKFVDDALQSIKDQTFKNWECIIINDGSSDKTEEKVLSFIKDDERFKYFPQKNAGVSAARNAGIRRSEGEYIMFLDGDDILLEKALEESVSVFEKNDDALMVYSDTTMFNNDKTISMPVLEKSFTLRELLLKNKLYISSLFRKESLHNRIYFDEKMPHYCEDWEFWIALMVENPDKIPYKIDYHIFKYRQHASSALASFTKQDERDNASFNYIHQKYFEEYVRLLPPYVKNYDRLLFYEKKLQSIYNSKFYKIYNQAIALLKTK